LSVPAGWLSGSVLTVSVLAATGRAKQMPEPLSDLGMLLTGTALGSAATPEAIAASARYPLSIACLIASMVAVTLASAFWLARRPGWTKDEAMMASVPGSLGTALAVAASRGGKLPQIAVVQLFRLIALVAFLPSLALLSSGQSGALKTAMPAHVVMGALDMAAILGIGLMLGLVLRRFGMSAPCLLGAMAVSVAAHGLDVVHGSLPDPIIMIAFVLLGQMIGSRMRGLSPAMLRQSLPDAIGSFLIGLFMSGLFAWLAIVLTGARVDAAIIAFAPGGFEAMIGLSLMLNAEPLYVSAHHLTRFLAIGFLLPMIFRSKLPEA
jgi:uncharacterized protein